MDVRSNRSGSARTISVLFVSEELSLVDAVVEALDRFDDRIVVTATSQVPDESPRQLREWYDCVLLDDELARSKLDRLIDSLAVPDDPLPVIVLTSDETAPFVERALGAGVNDVFAKRVLPDQPSLLGNRIQNTVRNTASADSLQRIAPVLDETTDLILVLDETGSIVHLNATVEDTFGYDREELRDTPVFDLIHPAVRTETRDLFADVVETDTSGSDHRFRVECRDGSNVTLESVKWTTLSDGTLDDVLLVARNVDQEAAYKEELERKEEQLNEFASIISHDLRNPLNVAKLRLALLRDEHESENIEILDTALDRMDSLIDDLLLLAGSGFQVTNPVAVSLESVCEECWRNVDTLQARLSIETDLIIRAERDRLKQVLENLFRNAIEHGGESVTVRVGELEDGFFVEDDGPGIRESAREEVFDAGFSSTGSGSGIGLYIVRQVALAHEWDVTVTSGEEGGARFEIRGLNTE